MAHPITTPRDLDAFVAIAGSKAWTQRLTEIRDLAASGPRAGLAIRQRHAVELAVERLRAPARRTPTAVEQRLGGLAASIACLARQSDKNARRGLERVLGSALTGSATLAPLFHQMRIAALQQGRGFEVSFPGFEEDTSYDLLLRREGMEAEIVCDSVSAEEGRGVHRGAWFRLVDRVDPDLQIWLADHPGRYLLKMTLPQGLRGGLTPSQDTGDTLATLHARIRGLLESRSRHDHDEAIVLRLDPLLVAGAQADELGLLSSLRRQFGPEAHLSVTAAGEGVFVMAARAGTENGIAAAVHARMGAVSRTRLSGDRPGILAMLLDDTDRAEWRRLREQPEMEAECRRFLTEPGSKAVVSVSLASRLELFGMGAPDAAPDGEVRFRNPGHPAARAASLAPAVLSSV